MTQKTLLEEAAEVKTIADLATFLSDSILAHPEISLIENDETLPYLSALSGVLESEMHQGKLAVLSPAAVCRLLVIALFYE